MMKLLYRLYELENHIYHYNRRTKACINWFVGNLCASPIGQGIYSLIKPRMLSFPKRVQVETTSYCNAKCEMCPQPIMPRRNRHMDQEVYEKIIKELAKNRDKLNTLSFHFLNEPLMDPRLFERIKLAKDSGIRQTQLNTNAQLLNEEKAIKLIESGIDTVTFSLGGLEPETQDQRRVGTSLSSVEKNIDNFIALINSPAFLTRKPKVIIYTIKSSSEDKAWKPVVKKYKNQVNAIVVINQNNWGGRSKNIEKEQNLTEYRVPCPSIFTTMNINVDGKVNLCCVDWEDREIMGDLREQSVSEIWNGKMETYRRMHLQNRSEKIPMCKECTIYR